MNISVLIAFIRVSECDVMWRLVSWNIIFRYVTLCLLTPWTNVRRRRSRLTILSSRSRVQFCQFPFPDSLRLATSLAFLSQQWASVEWGARSETPVQGVASGTPMPADAFPATPLGSSGMKSGASFMVRTQFQFHVFFFLSSKHALHIQWQ